MTHDPFDPERPREASPHRRHPAAIDPESPGSPSEQHQLEGSRADGSTFVSNEDLLRFVDGALGDEGRVRVLTCLANRPAAVERVEAYLHQNARLRALREHLPLDDSKAFAAPLQAALVARWRRGLARRHWRRWGAAAAIALTVAGGAIGLTLEPWHSRTSPTNAPAGASPIPQAFFLFEKPEITALTPVTAAFDTAAEADRPSDASSADEAAFGWLASQLSDFSLEAPDFASIGLELVGGETLERQGTPAIRLIYRDEADNPVLLYVGIGKPDANHAFWLVREGYVSLQWRRGPVVFAIVTPTGSPQLSQVVDIVGAAVGRLPATEPSRSSDPSSRDNAALTDRSSVQSIAVPAISTTPSLGQSGDSIAVEPPTISPDATNDNQPEPL